VAFIAALMMAEVGAIPDWSGCVSPFAICPPMVSPRLSAPTGRALLTSSFLMKLKGLRPHWHTG
jgi:hypothetical protein